MEVVLSIVIIVLLLWVNHLSKRVKELEYRSDLHHHQIGGVQAETRDIARYLGVEGALFSYSPSPSPENTEDDN